MKSFQVSHSVLIHKDSEKTNQFPAQIPCIPLSHCMNVIGFRETQALTVYVECCGFKVRLINVLAALGIAGIGNELNC